MNNPGQVMLARNQVQIILAQKLPWHINHFIRDTGNHNCNTSEIIEHFINHKNIHGRTFASVFARIYRRYREEILSADNMWYAGYFFNREPSLVEATLYYLAFHRKFGLSLTEITHMISSEQ